MKIDIIDPKLFWTPVAIDSYDKLFNFIVGDPNCGKTYGLKVKGMKNFIKTEKQFIYMRRHSTEFVQMNNFFASIVDTELKEKWTVGKENTLLYDDKVGGYYYSLSDLLKKGTEFPDVSMVIFDEFIIHGGYQRYLKDELNLFFGAADAICRFSRQVKFYFIGNNVSAYNPYFLEIGYQPGGKEFWTYKDPNNEGFANECCVQWVKNEALSEAKAKTRFGRALKGTSYGDYALFNKSLNDNEDFIRKKEKGAFPLCMFKVDGYIYSIWLNKKTKEVNVEETVTLNNVPFFSVTEKDRTPGSLSMREMKNSMCWVWLIRGYDKGRLFYDSPKTKNATFKCLKAGVYE